MNYEKALSLYKNDKTLQLLRAEHFPLLMSFFHLVFKQQDRISYLQTELQRILGDYLFSLQGMGIEDYQKAPVDYLQCSAVWADIENSDFVALCRLNDEEGSGRGNRPRYDRKFYLT